MDENWYSRPLLDQLAEETGCDRKTVWYARKKLAAVGMIDILGKLRRYEGVTCRIIRDPPPDLGLGPISEEKADLGLGPISGEKADLGPRPTQTWAPDPSRLGPRAHGRGSGIRDREGGERESPGSSTAGAPPTPFLLPEADPEYRAQLIPSAKRWLRRFNEEMGIPRDKGYKLTGKYGDKILYAYAAAIAAGYPVAMLLDELIPSAKELYGRGDGVRAYYRPWYVLEMVSVLLETPPAEMWEGGRANEKVYD